MAEALLRAGPGVCVVTTSREPLRAAGGVRLPGAAARRPGRGRPSTRTTCSTTARSSSSWRAPRRWSHATCSIDRAGVGDGSHLPTSRRDPARDRARRRSDRGLRRRRRRVTARRSLPPPHGREPHGPSAAAHAAGDTRLESRPPSRIPSASSFAVSRSWRAVSRSTRPTSIAADPELAEGDVVECVANLVAKSLISVDLGGAVTWYRLLETTRAYAREKLAESGEIARFRRRHAEYHRALFERARHGVARSADRRVAGHVRPAAR